MAKQINVNDVMAQILQKRGFVRARFAGMVSKSLSDHKSQFIQYILRFFDQLCSLL